MKLVTNEQLLPFVTNFTPFITKSPHFYKHCDILTSLLKIVKKGAEHIMKKLKSTIRKAVVRFTLQTAKEGAGLASSFGIHQPKVPSKLAK